MVVYRSMVYKDLKNGYKLQPLNRSHYLWIEDHNGHGLLCPAGPYSQLPPMTLVSLWTVYCIWSCPVQNTTITINAYQCRLVVTLESDESRKHSFHLINCWKAWTIFLASEDTWEVSDGLTTAQDPPLYFPKRKPTVLSSPSAPTPITNSHLFLYSVCKSEGHSNHVPWYCIYMGVKK